MKVLLSGGHLTPAIALIDYIQAVHPKTELIFAGRMYTRKQVAQPAKEKEEVEKRGVLFIAFDSGKFSSHNPLVLFINGILFLMGLLKALSIVLKQKPSVYISFGSHLSIPLAIVCKLFAVPIVVHEQTRTVGFANSFVGKLATKIALSFKESAAHFPTEKIVVTGNPIRKTVLSGSTEKPSWYTTRAQKKIMYVTGGSQGSEILNSTIAHSLKWLATDWIIIHQCGMNTASRNYKKELENASAQLAAVSKQQYIIREWITEDELSWIYKHAYCAISRAGANTVLELQAVCLPSILVPLPFSHNNEQLISAKKLSDEGKAILLQQKDLSPETLRVAIQQIESHHTDIQSALTKDVPAIQEAVTQLYSLLVSVTKSK